MSKINYMGPCKCMFGLFTLVTCKCKCKKIGDVGVNDLHLHGLYQLYIQLLTLTCTTLVKASVGLVLTILTRLILFLGFFYPLIFNRY